MSTCRGSESRHQMECARGSGAGKEQVELASNSGCREAGEWSVPGTMAGVKLADGVYLELWLG